MSFNIQDVLKVVEEDMAKAADAALKANAPKLLAEAARLNVSGEAALASFIEGKISEVPELAPFAAVIDEAIALVGPKLVAAAGGEEQAIMLAAEAALAKIA